MRQLTVDLFTTVDQLPEARAPRSAPTQILGATGGEPTFVGLPDLNLELVEANVLDSRHVDRVPPDRVGGAQNR